MKSTDVCEAIARAVETDVRLLPFLPELLADLWELGTSSEHVIAALRSAGVARESTALDLGCGKGAVAVALAEAWGDELIEEIVCSAVETRAVNEKNTQLIRERRRQIQAANRDAAPWIDEYVARQEHETCVLGTHLICATWVLRRA